MGIGQISLRFQKVVQVVDSLPPMYSYELVLGSQKPKEISAYDTIVIPFDKYIWFFTFGCIITQFLLLVVMQNVWSHVTGTHNPADFLFEGILIKNFETQ